jgi:single-strand DNA-binding protein
MNKFIGMGRLVRDPEMKASGNGTDVCRFTVAIDRAFAKQGEERKTDFVDCITFGKQAAFVEKYFHKGDGIAIEGRFESNKWVDKDGNNRMSWSVTVDRVEFTPSRKTESSTASAQTFAEPSDESDDECPF